MSNCTYFFYQCCALTLLTAMLALPAQGAPTEIESTPRTPENSVQRIIVKFRGHGVGAATINAQRAPVISMRELSDSVGVELNFYRDMSTGAKVLSLPQAMPLAEVESITKKIAADPAVEYAEPDYRMYPHAVPNDPQFSSQWHLTDYLGGINAPAAWDISTGSSNTVVAVLDSGRTAHPDLDARMLPGYDFITNPLAANDSDGRDSDASDSGDWVTAADKTALKDTTCDLRDSSWHGTLVAGVIGASAQNGRDTAGIDWAARILPVRVLGKCGGDTSDIADAMMWAAGNTVQGVPDNPNPAKVLNLSLGSEETCPSTFQNVVTQLVASGKIIVVSAGNENNANDHAPASCRGVINVAAIGRSGSKASYSNFGAKVTLTAPGGDSGDPIITLGNTGTTVPNAATVSATAGTSFSAPTVSGIVSLMLAIRPDLDSVTATRILAATVRPFPDSTCNTGICGAGIVDAAAALRATRDLSLGVATSVGFADADIGKPNPDLVLKVTNLAALPVSIFGGSAIGGVSSGDFSISSNTCTNVALEPNGACNITLRFNPTSKDFRQADLFFNASDGRTYRVSLAGFAYSAATISQTPAGSTGAPQYVTKGPDGNLWFTDSGGLSIGRVTPSGVMTRFNIPWASDTVRNIVLGPDGNLWFTELVGNRIGRVTPTGNMTQYALPRSGEGALGIAAGPDGGVWYTANSVNRVGRVDTGSGQIAEYRLPSAGSSPIGIVTGPNNVMWILNSGSGINKIARLSIPGVSGALNYSDMWWAGTSENGWGMSIQQHGNIQFNAVYVYDDAGKPVWYVMPDGSWNADYTRYAGPVYQPTSAPLNNYSPAQFAPGSPVGDVTIHFSSDSTATLQYTINGKFGQKSLQRQVFGAGSAPLLVGDMWWGGDTQNGWGINLVQQSGIVFGVWYSYGPDGKSTWYVLPNGSWTGTSYSGSFYSTTGSAWLGAPYNPAQLVATPVGTMSFNFANANNANFSYHFTAGLFSGVSQTKPLIRQPY